MKRITIGWIIWWIFAIIPISSFIYLMWIFGIIKTLIGFCLLVLFFIGIGYGVGGANQYDYQTEDFGDDKNE